MASGYVAERVAGGQKALSDGESTLPKNSPWPVGENDE
jgi:hypothetical protein